MTNRVLRCSNISLSLCLSVSVSVYIFKCCTFLPNFLNILPFFLTFSENSHTCLYFLERALYNIYVYVNIYIWNIYVYVNIYIYNIYVYIYIYIYRLIIIKKQHLLNVSTYVFFSNFPTVLPLAIFLKNISAYRLLQFC